MRPEQFSVGILARPVKHRSKADAHVHRARGAAPVPVYTLTGVAALVLAAAVLQLWHADFRIPFYYANGGDNYFSYCFAKWFAEHWNIYGFNPRLAAPFGTSLGDWPQISTLHYAIQRILAIVSGDAGVAINVYYLAFFPLSAVTAMFALRRFGLSPIAAFAPAVLFALLPYRFFRNEAHIYYASYWFVPITVLACVIVARGNAVVVSRSGPLRIQPTRMGWFLAVTSIVTACDNQYHAFFAVFFLIVAAGLGVVRTQSWKPAAVATFMAALILATVALQMLPTFIYQRVHGANASAYTRFPNEAQIYGLQVIQLLLPVEGHRLPRLAERRGFFDTHSVYTNENSSVTLGAIGAIGFLLLLTALLRLGQRAFASDLQTVAVLNIFGVLFATVGGFGAFFNFFVRPEIRAYNRIGPFIGFFALTGVAYALAWVIRHRAATVRRSIVWTAVVALTFVGTVEQTTASDVPPYAASAALFAADEAFGKAVDAALPPNAAIFELPVFPFPEGASIGSLVLSSEMRPYLHTRSSRWSFAATSGRAPATWDARTGALLGRDLVRALLLGGFQAVCVFRDAYPDRGQALEASVAAIVGPPVAVDGNQGIAVYSLAAFYRTARTVDKRIGTPAFIAENVDQTQVTWGDGFYGEEHNSTQKWHWAEQNANLVITNEHPEPVRIHVSGSIEIGSRPDVLTIRSADRIIGRLANERGKLTPVTFDYMAPPGQSRITFSTNAPALASTDVRDLVFEVVDASFTYQDGLQSQAIDRVVGQSSASVTTGASSDRGGGETIVSHGCSPTETLGNATWRWCGREVEIDARAARVQHIRMRALVTTPGAPGTRVQMRTEGGWKDVLSARGGSLLDEVIPVGTRAVARLSLRTSATSLKVTGDSRDLVLRLDNLNITPER